MGTVREPTASHPTLIQRPLNHCHECSSTDLEPIVAIEAEQVHFLCNGCGRCWHVELGYVQRVRPSACYGCVHQERCAALYEADHASR